MRLTTPGGRKVDVWDDGNGHQTEVDILTHGGEIGATLNVSDVLWLADAIRRESGGSLPDHLEQEAQKFGRALDVLGLDPPVLNKSGGSDVEEQLCSHGNAINRGGVKLAPSCGCRDHT